MEDKAAFPPKPSPLRANEKLYKLARGDIVKIKVAQINERRLQNSDAAGEKDGDDKREENDKDEDSDSSEFFDSKIKRLSDKLHQTLNLGSDDDHDACKKSSGSSVETKRKITF